MHLIKNTLRLFFKVCFLLSSSNGAISLSAKIKFRLTWGVGGNWDGKKPWQAAAFQIQGAVPLIWLSFLTFGIDSKRPSCPICYICQVLKTKKKNLWIAVWDFKFPDHISISCYTYSEGAGALLKPSGKRRLQ